LISTSFKEIAVIPIRMNRMPAVEVSRVVMLFAYLPCAHNASLFATGKISR
jgi:hypothetical protein